MYYGFLVGDIYSSRLSDKFLLNVAEFYKTTEPEDYEAHVNSYIKPSVQANIKRLEKLSPMTDNPWIAVMIDRIPEAQTVINGKIQKAALHASYLTINEINENMKNNTTFFHDTMVDRVRDILRGVSVSRAFGLALVKSGTGDQKEMMLTIDNSNGENYISEMAEKYLAESFRMEDRKAVWRSED